MSIPDDEAARYATIGARVRRARQAAGLSQEALAARVGLPRPSISKIESGQQQVRLHILQRLAAALQVPPGEICPWAGTDTALQPQAAIIAGLRVKIALLEQLVAEKDARIHAQQKALGALNRTLAAERQAAHQRERRRARPPGGSSNG